MQIGGSGGDALEVSPRPEGSSVSFSSGRSGFAGPAIRLAARFGDTSGRFEVARTIARVFPAHTGFVERVMKEQLLPPSNFPSGPYPGDRLRYKTDRIVEYETPAQTDGLGTYLGLLKNNAPIRGVAMLVGETPDLLLLSVRLPPDAVDLTSTIIQQVERQAAAAPH
jgi:hypothetical protein